LLINFLYAATIHGLRPIVTYRALALGAGPAEVGFVAASYAALAMFVAVPAGRWVDRFGERPFLLVGMTILGVVLLTMAASDNVPVLAAAMLALGAAHMIAAVAVQTLIANAGAANGRDGRFGVQTVVASLGQLVGPAIAGLLVASAMASETLLEGAPEGLASSTVTVEATDGVFLIGAAAAAIGTLVALSFWLRPPSRPEAAADGYRRRVPPRTWASISRVIHQPSMAQALIASLAVLACIDILVAYLPVYGVVHGIPVATIGLLLAVRAGASMASRILMMPLRRLLGRRRLLVASMGIAAIALAALPLAGSALVPLVVAVTVMGFGLGLGQPLTLGWIATQAPEDVRGTAIGMRLTANRLGQLGVPAVVGLVAGVAGVAAIFWSLGGLLGAAAGIVARAQFTPTSGSEAPLASHDRAPPDPTPKVQ
jgi:MFS family permease